LVVALLAIAGCKEVNSHFCDNRAHPDDIHCMDAAGTGGPCKTAVDCTTTDLPVCDLMESGGTCVHCTAEAELAQASKWFGRGRGTVIPLPFDLADYRDLPGPEAARARGILVMTWFHPLMDPRGGQNLLGRLCDLDNTADRSAGRGEAPSFDQPRDSRPLRERGRQARRLGGRSGSSTL